MSVYTFPAGKQRVFPKKGQTLVYSLSSNRGHQTRKPGDIPTTKSTTITVVDAATKEIVASNELAIYLNGGIHDTIMSPDGRHLFAADYKAIMGGDQAKIDMMESFSINNMLGEFYALGGAGGQSTMIKIDSLTLEPVQLIKYVGTVHHGSGMGRNYKNPNAMWVDVFQEDPDGAGFAIFDPDTLKVDCAVKYEAIGKGHFFTQIHAPEFGGQPDPRRA